MYVCAVAWSECLPGSTCSAKRWVLRCALDMASSSTLPIEEHNLFLTHERTEEAPIVDQLARTGNLKVDPFPSHALVLALLILECLSQSRGSLSCWGLGAIQQGSEARKKTSGECCCNWTGKSSDYCEKHELHSIFWGPWEATHQRVLMVGWLGTEMKKGREKSFLYFCCFVLDIYEDKRELNFGRGS